MQRDATQCNTMQHDLQNGGAAGKKRHAEGQPARIWVFAGVSNAPGKDIARED
jgi:hypothetical protein